MPNIYYRTNEPKQIESEHLIELAFLYGCNDYRVEGDWFGGVALKNRRPNQQDRMLAQELPAHLHPLWRSLSPAERQKVLHDNCIDLNQAILQVQAMKYSGSTGIFAVFDYQQRTCTLANVGDSRLLHVEFGENDKATTRRLNTLHNLDNAKEVVRLFKAGKHFKDGRLKYFRGQLGIEITRAFGDATHIPFGLVCEPDTYEFSFAKTTNHYFICSSDGLYEGNQALADSLYKPRVNRETTVQNNRHLSLGKLSLKLANEALRVGAQDNISIITNKFTSDQTEEGIYIVLDCDGHGQYADVAQYLQTQFIPKLIVKLENLLKTKLTTALSSQNSSSTASTSLSTHAPAITFAFSTEPAAQSTVTTEAISPQGDQVFLNKVLRNT